MWPYIGNVVEDILKTKVEPVVSENLPSPLSPFRFQRIELGAVVSNSSFSCYRYEVWLVMCSVTPVCLSVCLSVLFVFQLLKGLT